jgi:hypothetical protein
VLAALTERPRGLTVSSHAIAVIHVALGEHREAFECWIAPAASTTARWCGPRCIRGSIRCAPIRAFQDILKRVGFAA